MPCNRVNCAECLTPLALMNNLRGVQRYLNNMDRSVPMEALITIPFSAFPRFIVKGHNDFKEISKVGDYILTKSAHQEHLSFATLCAARQDNTIQWAYEAHHFYWAILHCDWINVEIVTTILKAGIVDPTQNQLEIILRYPAMWKHQEIYHLRPKTYGNPLNLIAVILKHP